MFINNNLVRFSMLKKFFNFFDLARSQTIFRMPQVFLGKGLYNIKIAQ